MSSENEKIWEDRAQRGSNYFTKSPIKSFFIVCLVVGALGFGLKLVMAPINFANNAAKVAQQEFSPQAMLKKYEWFKNVAATLSAKSANIKVLKANIADIELMERADMDRQDKTDLRQGRVELAGVVMSYNNLAADWNAQISKFHWEPFTSSLPKGAEQILRQNFAQYKDGSS